MAVEKKGADGVKRLGDVRLTERGSQDDLMMRAVFLIGAERQLCPTGSDYGRGLGAGDLIAAKIAVNYGADIVG